MSRQWKFELYPLPTTVPELEGLITGEKAVNVSGDEIFIGSKFKDYIFTYFSEDAEFRILSEFVKDATGNSNEEFVEQKKVLLQYISNINKIDIINIKNKKDKILSFFKEYHFFYSDVEIEGEISEKFRITINEQSKKIESIILFAQPAEILGLPEGEIKLNGEHNV